MNKLKKRIASIITAAAVAFGSIGALPQLPQMTGFVVPAYAESADPVSTWEQLNIALTNSGNYKLVYNITANENFPALCVPSGTNVMLDLNGYTLDRHLSTAKDEGYVIKVQGSLTLIDSSTKKNGKITGGNVSTFGSSGGVCVDGGTFTMNGGTISENRSMSTGGGVTVVNRGTFNMSDGTISGNSADDGGGVCIINGAFTMSGGTISGNSSEVRGGGVYNVGVGTFNMSGGTISGNSSEKSGGGVYGSNICISGNPKITGNVINGTKNETTGLYTGDTASNVLSSGIIKVTGALSDGAEIGINLDTPGVFAEGYVDVNDASNNYTLTASDFAKFTSDDPKYAPVLNSSGKAEMVSAWGALQSKLNSGGTIKLLQDYTAGEGDSYLEVPSGKTVTLDLNGHTIDRGLKEKDAIENGFVITVEGNLTLIDSSEEQTGEITGGKCRYYGGGVFVDSNATFTMTGGTISGNSADYGGGVYVADGTFTMSGGTISGNSANDGGGVYVFGPGKFEMSGGTISGNNSKLGGGVEVGVGCSFTMSGGTITGNNSDDHGGGVFVNPAATFNLSGAAKITGNVKGGTITNGVLSDGTGTAYNVGLGEDVTITVTGALSDGAEIGIYIIDTPGVFAEGYVDVNDASNNYTLTASDVEKFASDDPKYVPVLNSSDKAEMVSAWGALQSKLNSGGTIKLLQDYTAGESDNALTVPSGKTVTLDLNGHTINRKLTTATANGYVIKVEGELTLKDTSEGKTGTITGGNNTENGGGVYIAPSGKFTMESGNISGNTSNNGGGVYVDGLYLDDESNNGSFIMTGGTITGNIAKYDDSSDGNGGGVYVYFGTFTMSGGKISGNTAKYSGGVNIYLGKFTMSDTAEISGNKSDKDSGGVGLGGGTFNMNGGTITGNIARRGGGVDVNQGTFNLTGGTITGNNAEDHSGGVWYSGGLINISGNPIIKDNVKGGTITDGVLSGGTASNVCFDEEMDLSLYVTGALTGDAEIYINNTSGVFAEGSTNPKYTLTTADMTHFRCDDSDYAPGRNSDGKGVMLESWAGLQKRLDSASTNSSSPTVIKLTHDYTAGAGDTALEIKSGKYVTIDLNGYTIDRGLKEKDAKVGGCVIKVEGNLTLTDSGSGEGKVTGGNNTGSSGGSGGGVRVEGGTFTMTGGTISGNSTYFTNGGGVVVDSNATFTMTGGTISGNNVIGSNGGGVLVAGNAKFEMSGGTISGNSASASNATCRGGGVCVKPTGTFTMSGGTISGNNTTTYGGGVYVYPGATFNLSGTPKITDNVKDGTLDEGVYTGGTANNVFLNDETIKITGALTGADIGIYGESAGVVAKPKTDYTISENDAAAFKSDNVGLKVVLNAGNVELVHEHSFTYSLSKTTSDNDTLVATCSGECCDLTGKMASLTIVKPLHEKYGDDKEAAANVTGDTKVLGTPTVSYQKKTGNTTWGTATTTAPTDAGTYKASITLGTGNGAKTAYVEYTIAKKAGPSAPETVSASHTDTTVTVTAPAQTDTATYEYSINSIDWQTGTEFTKLSPNTSYTIRARVAATDNFEAGTATTKNILTSLTVTVSGTPSKGCALTAAVLPAGLTDLTYQWYRGSSEISGATESTYVLTENDIGSKLHVAVSMTSLSNSGVSAETAKISDCAHTRTEIRGRVAATCTTAGYSGDKYCKDCGLLLEEGHTLPASHSLSSYVSSKPTCTEPGQRIYTCSVCNYSYKEDIPALGHEPDEEVEETIKEATCTENGQIDVVVYCKRCNYEISRYSRTVWALGHEPAEAVRENETEATCEEDGSYDEVVYCSRCGYEISRYTRKTRALGHKYDPTTGLCPQCGQYDPSKFCTVMFNTDGGTAIPSQGIKPNGKATKPADPEKKGHTFKGWFVGNTEYDFDSVVTKSFTITAKWEINNYTVTFVTNCDTTIEPVTVAFNKTVSEPSGLTKEGYHLVEWQCDGKAFSFATPITDNITLTALWEIDKHTVTFVTDCDTTIEPIEVEHGKAAAIPRTPERTGHTFVEWQLGGTAYDFTAPVNADITLTAVWKINVYTVTFDSNGGSAVAAQKVEFGKTATKPDDPTRKKIAFLGWQLNGADYDFATPVTADITLVANWDIEKFTVTFDSNGGSAVAAQKVENGKTASEPAAPTREGYTFKGWFNGEKAFSFSTKITADITLTAKWEISKYTVNFDSNGGSAVAAQKVEHGKTATAPTAPTKTGAEFIGWMLDGTAYDFATPVTANITLTAQWKSAEFTVTFMLNGALHSTAKVEYGKKITFPKLTAGEGKIILAWYNDAALTSLFVTSTVVTSDLTLYAAEKEKAPVMENGEPVEGGVSGAIGGAAGENTTITLTDDENAGKLTFPKPENAKEITIDGGGNTLYFSGAASIKPNQELTLTNLTIRAEKGGNVQRQNADMTDGASQEIKLSAASGNAQNITLTAAAGGLTLENVTLDGKKSTINAKKGNLRLGNITAADLTLNGAANTSLTVDGTVSASKISGFGKVIAEADLTIGKSLTINELVLADGAVLTIAKGATVTIKKGISGTGTIKLSDGFKPISISGNVSGKIMLTADKALADGTQIFTSKAADIGDHFDVSGIAPAVTDGEYEYGLYAKSNKVYLRAFKLELHDKAYCELSDVLNAINKANQKSTSYELKLLGNCDLGSSFKLPGKGKYAGLTINGNGHNILFKGKTLSLTGDLTLKDVTISSTNGAWTIKTNGYTLDDSGAELINCMKK